MQHCTYGLLFLPNFILIGASHCPCGQKLQMWKSWGIPHQSIITDQTEIRHAPVNLWVSSSTSISPRSVHRVTPARPETSNLTNFGISGLPYQPHSPKTTGQHIHVQHLLLYWIDLMWTMFFLPVHFQFLHPLSGTRYSLGHVHLKLMPLSETD